MKNLQTTLLQENPALQQQTIKGVVWTVLGYGGSQSIRFASNLLLTRMLFPELFGLMGITNVLIIGLQLFSDVGIGYSIVQNKQGDEADFYNTAWTIQVVRGLLLWLICLGMASPIAQLYNHPELAWLAPLVGFTTVISGFNSTALYSLERHLNVRKQVLVEISIQIVGTITMLVWAYFSPTIWSLALGGLVSSLLKLIWSHHLVPTISNYLQWQNSAAKEIFSVGQWVFLSTAMMFLAEQADRLMLGAMFPLGLFGIYQIALTLADIPRQVITSLAGKVILPVVCKVVDNPRERVISSFLKNRRVLLIPFALITALMAGLGDLIIRFLYDARYHEGSWMLPILAIGLWPRLLAQTSEPFLLTLGQFKYTAYGNLSRLGVTVVGILIGFHYFQALGAISAVALNDVSYYLIVTIGLAKEGFHGLTQDALMTAILLAFLFIILLMRSLLHLGLPFVSG